MSAQFRVSGRGMLDVELVAARTSPGESFCYFYAVGEKRGTDRGADLNGTGERSRISQS
jgi:hypothetical protein